MENTEEMFRKNIVDLPFINELGSNIERILEGNDHFLQVILGPRQVGKTTSVKHFFEKKYKDNYSFHSADQVFHQGLSWIKEKWEKAKKQQHILIIDEIQKIENWSQMLKMLFDEQVSELQKERQAGFLKETQRKNKVICVLLGSSSLDLHRGLTESLTGRFQLTIAHHWNFHESSQLGLQKFDDYLMFGGYPGSYQFCDDIFKWQQFVRFSIIDTVVDKDILSLHRVKSPELFRQAFDILMSYPAQEISYTKLLGQIQDKGNVELVKHYIRLFEGAFLLKTLSKYSPKPYLKKSSAPKILPLAPCLSFVQGLAPYSASEKGRVFEMSVGMALNRLSMKLSVELMYWREGAHEVDFILKLGKRLWAIEVKSGSKRKVSGLDYFIKQHPEAMPLIIDHENYHMLETNPYKLLGLI